MEFQLADGGTIYYQTHGEKGDWLVFLNGIMMNCMSWLNYVPKVAPFHRLLLLDFRDQGKSSCRDPGYTSDVHVEDLIEMMDHLQIEKAHMMGVSYGGQVALHFVRQHPERLHSLSLVTVIPFVTRYMQAFGDAWETAAKLQNGADFFSLAIPPIYSESFYLEHWDWLKERQKLFHDFLTPQWFDGFLRLSQSAQTFDLRKMLKEIRVPTLLISAEKDILTPKDHMKEMARKIPGSIHLEIPDAGHGAFLEKPEAFLTALLGFTTCSYQIRLNQE